MELKRELTPEEMNKVSGGTGEEQGIGIDTDDGKQQHGIPDYNQQEFGQNHPVYCSRCKKLLGYSECVGTTSFTCPICLITSY